MTAGAWALPPALYDMWAGEDAGFITDLMETFQTDTGRRLQQARLALADYDWAELKAEIHTIKGSAMQIGANALISKCEEIEGTAGNVIPAQLHERVNELEALFTEVCDAIALFLHTSERP